MAEKRRHRGEGSVSKYATKAGPRYRGQCPGGRPRKGGFLSSAAAWGWVRDHVRVYDADTGEEVNRIYPT